VVIFLERGANGLCMVQLMPLPPHHLLLQENPEWFTFLVPAYPGCPGKKAIKWTRTLTRCAQPAPQVCLPCNDHTQSATPTSHRSVR